jgi:hypothetical protein
MTTPQQEKRKPKIFCFLNQQSGGNPGMAYAIAEDGTILGTHFCSCDGYVPEDLGVSPGTRPDRHETYKEHYPDGYEMEFIPCSELQDHEGAKKAWELNQKMGDEARSGKGQQASIEIVMGE